MSTAEKLPYRTPSCRVCGRVEVIELTQDQYKALEEGDRHVQDIIPEVDPGIREMLISRTCPTCWDDLFKDLED